MYKRNSGAKDLPVLKSFLETVFRKTDKWQSQYQLLVSEIVDELFQWTDPTNKHENLVGLLEMAAIAVMK